jgi:PAS domain S-box-containing protein
MDFPHEHNASSRRTLEREYRILHADGSIRWVRDRAVPVEDEDGQVIAVQGFMRDITAVRSLSGQLVKTEKRYRLMADNASDLIYAHDTTGHIYYVSPSVERYLQATPEEFIGTHFSQWLSDNPINSAAFEAFDAEINAAQTVTPFMLELKAIDGRTVLMEFNESLIHDGEGRVVGVQGVGRDVTEREETLRSLREHRKRLDAANTALKALVNQSRRRQERAVELTRQLQEKNAELESFVHIVSHDLRSPLITLRGLASQLRRRFSGRLDEHGKGVVQQIGEEATRLSHLIGDLLVYARASANPGARRAVDAGLMMDTVWTRLTESGHAEDAAFTRPQESRIVWADPVALERVFENLMSNAVMHRHPDRPPRIEANWTDHPDRVEFRISDNGIGIEPEDRPHIFELFYRGRNAQTIGSGLGLAIVKRIVDTSGAKIRSSPNADGGSVFALEWQSQPPAADPN